MDSILWGGRATHLLDLRLVQQHLSCEVISKIQLQGTQVDSFPGGYTGTLQVLDKGINKPFKGKLQAQHLTWMIGNKTNAKAKRQDVARWIATACEEVTASTITNTWCSIGIHGHG